MVIHTFMKIIHVITLSETPSESDKKNRSYLVHLFLNPKQFFQLDPKSYSLDLAAHECWLHTETKGIVRRFKYDCANFEVIQARAGSESQGGTGTFTVERSGKHQCNQAIKLGLINAAQVCVTTYRSNILDKTLQSASDYTWRPNYLYTEISGDRTS